MYRAVLGRDASFEGVFFVGVRTTGIFCRPTCPAKKPKVENVEFFPSVKDAIGAGYRPCSRCHPLDTEPRPPEAVRKLTELIENSPDKKINDADLKEMGIDPSTARRQFQRHYGMTFRAYSRALRMGKALHDIRDGQRVIDAQLETGFESASGFWDAFKTVFGAPPSRSENVNCLIAKWIDTPLGAMLALGNSDGIHLLEFVDRQILKSEISELRKLTGSVVIPGSNPYLEKLADEMKSYFAGESLKFTVPIIMIGSPFEKSVWKLLGTIPPGQTWSYAEMARKIGRPTAARAVGRANGMNHLALIIPCHRVIRADGTLCGYGGGIWRKKWLLEHERRIMRTSRGARPGMAAPSSAKKAQLTLE